MGKNTRHKKLVKSEKAKVKLRGKTLPKGLNITDASFKTRKIVIQEQLKHYDNSQILSRRKLDVKALLTRLQHHNTKARLEAIKELKEIFAVHAPESVCSPMQPLLQGVLSMCLDKEKDIRRESLKATNMILAQVSSENLLFYSNVIIPYLGCTMTHINPGIREDSLLFLDSLLNNCSLLIAKNSDKILPNFLDLISRLRTESQPGRQLTTTLNSKNTSIKWTTKVFSSLARIFDAVVNMEKSERVESATLNYKETEVESDFIRAPIFVNHNLLQPFPIDFDDDQRDCEDFAEAGGFLKYTNEIMPLMFDTWIEVSPKEKTSSRCLAPESLALLRNILAIVQSTIEYAELLESKNDTNKRHLSSMFKSRFQASFVQRLFSNFPYVVQGSEERPKKRQRDFIGEAENNCLNENLALCHVHIWFTKVQTGKKKCDALNQDTVDNVLDYLTEKLESWSKSDNVFLPELMRVLRTLFLQASEIWYKNKCFLGNLMKVVLEAYLRPGNKDFQAQLFSLFNDIALDRNLEQLHGENIFQEFVSSLPRLLLNSSLHERTIQLLNYVVLRERNWVKDYLIKHRDEIIENSRSAEIEGSKDVHESRLTICNLFYFIDGTVYY